MCRSLAARQIATSSDWKEINGNIVFVNNYENIKAENTRRTIFAFEVLLIAVGNEP